MESEWGERELSKEKRERRGGGERKVEKNKEEGGEARRGLLYSQTILDY